MSNQRLQNKEDASHDKEMEEEYLRSAIFWHNAVNEIREQESSSSVSNEALVIEHSWDAFQKKNNT